MLPFGREYELRLWDKQGVVKVNADNGGDFSTAAPTTILHDLDIQFQVHRTSTFVNKARVSVCGMNAATISKFLSLFSYLSKDGLFAHMELYAGYRQSDGSPRVGRIIGGDILTCIPSSPPTVWTTMECWTGFSGFMELKKGMTFESNEKDPVTKMPKALTLYDAASIISKLIFGKRDAKPGEFLDFRKNTGLEQMTKDISIGRINVSGNVDRMLRQLNSYDNNIKFMMKDGKLFVFNIRDVQSFYNDYSHDASMVISPESGMIGLPRITNCGLCVDVDVMLDPRYEVFDKIGLRSSYLSRFNPEFKADKENLTGQFRILGITHRGHLRGGEWKTTLHLLNDQFYDPNVSGANETSYFDDTNKIAKGTAKA